MNELHEIFLYHSGRKASFISNLYEELRRTSPFEEHESRDSVKQVEEWAEPLGKLGESHRNIIHSEDVQGDRKEEFSDAARINIMLQIFRGMMYIHSMDHNIMHRDLKPSNVLVKRSPEHFEQDGYVSLKVADFGLAKIRNENCQMTSKHVLGTTLYSAPEVYKAPEMYKANASAHQPAKSDVYSYGMVAYEILPGNCSYKLPTLHKARVTDSDLERISQREAQIMFDNAAITKGRTCKRVLGRSWNAEEIQAVLQLMKERAMVNEGPYSWDYVSGNLYKRFEFDRASDSCKQQWFTLLQSYRAILDYESKVGNISYWDMNEDERSNKELPRSFDFEWCELIERILAASRSVPETGSIFDEDEGLSSDSAATIESSQAESTVDSHVSETDQITYDVETNSGRKRSATAFDEDYELFLRIAPFVEKQVEDALKPRLSALLEENLALKRTLRQKIQKL